MVCGKEFDYVHGKGTKTCSRECLCKLRSKLLTKDTFVTKICKCCGKEYQEKKWVKGKGFCSPKCVGEYRRTHKEEYKYVHKHRFDLTHETRTCEMCGKEFVVSKKVQKRFCSADCRVKYQNTREFQDKKAKTMLERYGKKSLINTANNAIRYQKLRDIKYRALCEKSNMTLLEYVDMYVLKVRCNKCGKEFITNNLMYVDYPYIACKQCGDEYKDHKPAMRVLSLLDELGISYVKNDRSVIHPYEIDILLSQYNIGFEINGNFWHSELCGKNKDYHIKKTKMCDDKGIKLVHIFEDEIENKWDIVKSNIVKEIGMEKFLLNSCECDVKEISPNDKKEFLCKTHIEGNSKSSVNVGLFHGGSLVSVMTFYNGKKDKEFYELMRFSEELDTTVDGGFEKMFKYFLDNYRPRKVVSSCDVRWNGLNGGKCVFGKNGFALESVSKPKYWYLHKTDMLNRLDKRLYKKSVMLKEHQELDCGKTEWEIMQELGFNRIWDCGRLNFSLNFGNDI